MTSGNESAAFKEGVSRSESGSSSAKPVIDIGTSKDESAARERGFEAGESAKATAKASSEQSKADQEKK